MIWDYVRTDEGSDYTLFHWETVSKAVDESWAKIGVHCVTRFGNSNIYYIDGKEVLRVEAYDYASKKLSKTYEKDDYLKKLNISHVKKRIH